MERDLALLLFFLVGLLQQGRGGPLEVEPREPVVAVALGGSRQLTCRLACEGHRAASVQWRGLDTSLGAVQSGAGSSVLSVQNASLSAAGTRVCVGSCGNLTFQHKVQLLVFGEPHPSTPPRLCTSPAHPAALYCLRPYATSSRESPGIAHPAPAQSLHGKPLSRSEML
ncbi:mucosal addressin cell adhesion molecule 1-like, partial [Pteropus medius]|uniref:mucosal addressin cell adhesion molecule 1-like n=1 Tax=Pteropus vampyrus TaxID=132908 RepID=UPI00196AD660